jgi:hypothetical protein
MAINLQDPQKPQKTKQDTATKPTKQDDATSALKAQKAQNQIQADLTKKRIEGLRKTIELRGSALEFSAGKQAVQNEQELHAESMRVAKSDASLAEAQNEAQKLAIANEVEGTYGIPAADFLASQDATLSRIGEIQEKARGSFDDLDDLRLRAFTEKEDNFLSNTLGAGQDFLGGILGLVGINIGDGKETFGSDADIETIIERLQGIEGIQTARTGQGNALAQAIVPAEIRRQTAREQIFADLGLAGIGAESEANRLDADLTAKIAGVEAEGIAGREEREIKREDLDLRRGVAEDTKKARARTSALEEQKFTQQTFQDEVRNAQVNRGQDLEALRIRMQSQAEGKDEPAIQQGEKEGLLRLESVNKASGMLLQSMNFAAAARAETDPDVKEARTTQADDMMDQAIESVGGAENLVGAVKDSIAFQKSRIIEADPEIVGEPTRIANARILEELGVVLKLAEERANLEETATRAKEAIPFVEDKDVAERLQSTVLRPPLPEGSSTGFLSEFGNPSGFLTPEQLRARSKFGVSGPLREDYLRILEVRRGMRTVAQKLGLSGHLFSPDTQRRMEKEIASQAGRGGSFTNKPNILVDKAMTIMQAHFSDITNALALGASPDDLILRKEQLGKSLEAAGFTDNIFSR